jgi:ribosome-associated translation inhibitor RaiA
MKQPLQLIFHSMKASAVVEDAASTRATQLERFASDIMSCPVVVDVRHRHKQYGRPSGVRIGLTLPGHKPVVDRPEFEDIDVSFCEAFDNMERQLEDAVRLRCGDEKLHPCQWHGCLLRLTTSMGSASPALSNVRRSALKAKASHPVAATRLEADNIVRFIATAPTAMGLIALGRFRRARPRWSMNLGRLTVRKTHEGCLLQGQKRRCGEAPV